MKDDLQEINKQKEISEGLFDRIFSRTEPIKPQSKPQGNPDFYQAQNGVFVFGGKSTAKELNEYAKLSLAHGDFDVRNSKLNFILFPGTEFHAEQLSLDLKKQVITFFRGTWLSGPFIGETFRGDFNGSTFQGDFYGPYTNYESKPETFVDGTFRDTTGKGILGLPNTITLHKLGNRKVNLITIPVGHYLQFRSNNGITCYIKILKRLDGINSNFIFEILDGFTGDKNARTITVSWNNFREDFIKNADKSVYNFNKSSKNIGNLIQIPEGDSIKEMYISTAPATFVTPAAAQTTIPIVSAPVEPEISTSQEPGMSATEIDKILPESLRKTIRGIINDSF